MSAAILNTPAAPATGWTNPTTIYDLMRRTDAKAKELDALVQANVVRTEFKLNWNAWYTRWRAFFDKYQSDYAKLGVLFSTDSMYQDAIGWNNDLQSWNAGYAAEKDANGNPVPKSVTPMPIPGQIPSGDEKKSSGLPWWAWVLIIGGVGGVGYLFYKGVKRESEILGARGRALEGGIAKLLPGPFGAAFGAAHHDPPGRNMPRLPSRDVPLIMSDLPALGRGSDFGDDE